MRSSCQSFCLGVAGLFLAALAFCGCANKGYPEGGPRDVTPPHVTEERPASFSTGFDKKSINIYFDEYVALKGINEKFIISPPQAKKPKVRLRAKYVMVEFLDSLRPDMTYSLDFADAIVDNNEGNPLGFYRYVFSTGEVIDTLELSGKVVDAATNEPVLNSSVFLYENATDSMPLKEIPTYMGLTDSSGCFRITNIREADYKVLAVMDENRDYKYTPEGERVAFLDTAVHPVVFPVTRTDTIGEDSIVERSFLAYGPNNLYLRMFMETPTQLYMTDEARSQREMLRFTFSVPAKNEFAIQLLDTVVEGDWYFREVSRGEDTVTLWIRDSSVYRRDTLRFALSYLRTDSVGMRSPYADTVKLVFTDKKKEDTKRKKKEEKPQVDFLKMTFGVGQEQDVNKGIPLEFDRPVTQEVAEHIRLLEKVDSLYEPVPFRLVADSTCVRKYRLEATWQPDSSYKIQVDSADIRDLYGRWNDKVEKKIRVHALEFYGKLTVHIENVEEKVILQLYKPDNRKDDKGNRIFNVVGEKRTSQSGDILFDFLHEGKYFLRAIMDANGDGRWTPGLYLRGLQAEQVRYLPVEINVKQNFDVEQSFDMRSDYIGGELKEDKSKSGTKKGTGKR